MRFIAPILAALHLTAFIASAEVPTADQVLFPAKAKASAEQKAIFLHFGASWCGWCKRLDTFQDRPDIKPVFDKYFIPVKLVVQEHGKNKVLENPAAIIALARIGRDDQRVKEALVEALKDLDLAVSESAGYALQWIDPEAAVKAGLK